MAGAAACSDSTQIPLVVTFVSGDPAFSATAMSGDFTVDSLTLFTGELSLRLGSYEISATVDANGTVEDARLDRPTTVQPPPGTITLSRL